MNPDAIKLFRDITVADLEMYPVWQSIEAKDDPSAFPIESLPVANLAGRFVGTRVRLANGNHAWAMLLGVNLTDLRKTEQMADLRIEHNGEWFCLAQYWDVNFKRRSPDALAQFLNLSVDEVFPIYYDLTGLAVGLTSVIKGHIPKEPRERLPEDEIIKMRSGY
jgi:hypothetical protein